ncbi:SRPBCC domain-containing protein [soil metagenome]
MKHQIKTEIIINAPRERVFQVLTNLVDYEKWNPFIIKSKGKAIEGSFLTNTMKNGDREMTFKPKVVNFIPNQAFEWMGSLWISGLFDGHHYFHLIDISDKQVNLIHGENFSGILASFILKKIGQQTRENFIAMNQALKEQSEKI